MTKKNKRIARRTFRKKGGFFEYIGSAMKSLHKKMRKEKEPRKFSQMVCSPGVIKDHATAAENTCYSKAILLKLKKAYNHGHPDTQIVGTYPKEIVNELRERLLPRCKKEDCWLNMLPDSQRKVIDEMVFAPDQPKEWKKNPDEWLSNFDMIDVLDQYEKAYTHFRLLGPTPIDFDQKVGSGKCVWQDICDFKVHKYEANDIKDVAFIFNLDAHDKNGSHWTSMYLNIPKRKMFYFDSANNDFPDEIKALTDRIVKESEDEKRPIKFDKNDRQHQFGNSECGMYALFFIITLLTGKCGGVGKQISFDRALRMFKSERIPDKLVFDFRAKYFNKQEGGEIGLSDASQNDEEGK